MTSERAQEREAKRGQSGGERQLEHLASPPNDARPLQRQAVGEESTKLRRLKDRLGIKSMGAREPARDRASSTVNPARRHAWLVGDAGFCEALDKRIAQKCSTIYEPGPFRATSIAVTLAGHAQAFLSEKPDRHRATPRRTVNS